MKRVRRLSVTLGLKKEEKRVDPSDGVAYTEEQFEEVYGTGCDEWKTALPEGPQEPTDPAAARAEDADQDDFDAAPGASVMPEFLLRADSWKAPALTLEPEPEPGGEKAREKSFKGRLRRMSLSFRDNPAESYAAPAEEPTESDTEDSEEGALASQGSLPPLASGGSLSPAKKKEGLLGRAKSFRLLNRGVESGSDTLQAVLEAERAQLQEVEEEERKQRLMLEQQRIGRDRAEKMKAAERATENAELRHKEIIRLRHEKLAEEEALAENEENLRRLRAAREREQKEKVQQRLEEQKARMMGNRDERRQAAWKLYQEQMELAVKSAGGADRSNLAAQGADLLWRIVAPGATVCNMEAAKAEIMAQVSPPPPPPPPPLSFCLTLTLTLTLTLSLSLSLSLSVWQWRRSTACHL
eukprot:COSAG03_NODE_1573_length_3855_cov_7.009052_3_plen_412_part_00